MTPRDDNYAQWYLDVIDAGDLVDSSPVKGCMVLRPNGMAIWEHIQRELDQRIKDTGAKNAYFPLLIPQSFLSKEAEHVDGFAKECAVVTHHRLRAVPDSTTAGLEPDPDSELAEPLIIRPTSETIIWHMFQRWIQSHRDLPLKINQWANVLRWEIRTRPFLRSSEFLWQEGHTAHATAREAIGCAEQMLDVYADFVEDYLAVPVVRGRKSPRERFAGAVDTYTIEAMMQNGWALQAGTSHYLGQNFARAFGVDFQTSNDGVSGGDRELVWATSWGVSTRLIGALVMVHSDDIGLVLPPRVAPVQVAVVPIVPTKKGKERAPEVLDYARSVADALRCAGARVEVDERTDMRPGAKFFEWERRGVPLRIEIGLRDLDSGSVMCARRIGGEKRLLDASGGTDALSRMVVSELDSIQTEMLSSAQERLSAGNAFVSDYSEMKTRLEAKDYGFFTAPWKECADAELQIKEETGATIRCYPIDRQAEATGQLCFFSKEPATHMAVFARAY